MKMLKAVVSRRVWLLASVGGAMAGGVPQHATAQQPGAPTKSTAGLEQIVVTARKRSENLQKVPVSVTAIGTKTLQQKKIVTAYDLQYHVANLQVQPDRLNGSGVPSFVLRGQTPVEFTDDNVATYFAEVPQGTRGIGYALFDMQSAQTFRGPQGTLFGKNSNGGALSFTPNRPIDAFTGYLQGQLGNYDDRDVQGMVNIPVSSRLMFRAAGEWEQRDGVVKNLAQGQDDLQDRNHFAIRGSMLAKPTDWLENLTVFDATNAREIPTPAIITDGSAATGVLGPLLGGIVNDIARQQGALGPFTTYRLTGPGPITDPNYILRTRTGVPLNTLSDYAREQVFGVSNITTARLTDEISFKNIFGYRNEQTIANADPSGLNGFFSVSPSFAAALAPTPVNFFLPINLFAPRTAQEVHGISNEDQISGTSFNKSLAWIVGGFYSNDKTFYQSISSGQFGDLVPLALNPHVSLDNKQDVSEAAYVQATYDLSHIGLNGFKVTAGGRYNRDYRADAHTDVTGAYSYSDPGAVCDIAPNQANFSAGSCTLKNAVQFHAKTYTLDLDYQVTPQVLIYAATRHGYKSGGLNNTAEIPTYREYQPETLTDYETGLKYQGNLLGMPVRSNIDFFYGLYKDIDTTDIITQPDATTALLIFNAAAATLKGVEYEATIKPVPELTIDLNYSYQKGVYDSGSVPAFYTRAQAAALGVPVGGRDPAGDFQLAGLQFAGAPLDQATVSAAYDITIIPERFGRVTVSGTYAYRSVAPGITVTGVGSVPAAGIANASINWYRVFDKPVDLGFFIKNLSNKTYQLSCSDNRGSIGYLACRYADPLTFGFTARYSF